MDRAFYEALLESLSEDSRKKLFKKLSQHKFAVKGFKLEKVSNPRLANELSKNFLASKIFFEEIIEQNLGVVKSSEYSDILKIKPTQSQISAYLSIYALLGQDESDEAKKLQMELSRTEDSREVERETPLHNEGENKDLISVLPNKKGVLSMKHIGYFQIIPRTYGASFYNFYPTAVIEGDSLSLIEDPKEIFPLMGNINLCFHPQNQSVQKTLEQKIKADECYVIDLQCAKLEDNYSNTGDLNKTNKKISAEELIRMRGIQPLSSEKIYFVVTPEREDFDRNTDEMIYVQTPNCAEGSMVLLRYQEELMGPFTLKKDSQNEKYGVSFPTEKQQYLMSKYKLIAGRIEDCIVSLPVSWGGSGSNICENAVCILSNFEETKIDCIPDKILLKEFAKMQVNLESKDDLSWNQQVALYADSAMAQNFELPENIQQERFERLKLILDNCDDLQEHMNELFAIFSGAIASNNDLFDELSRRILSDDAILNKFQNHRMVQADIRRKKEELEDIQSQISALESERQQREKDATSSVKSAEIVEEYREKAAELEKESAKLETEILAKKASLKNISAALSLQEVVEELKEDEAYYKRRIDDLKGDEEVAEKKIAETLDLAKTKVADIAFDGMISSKMLKAAADWEAAESQIDLRKQRELLSGLPLMQFSTENELVEYLQKEVQKYRPSYDKNAIVNLFICVAQGFLTVVSGAPGTGKTSICNILAHVLGLDQVENLLEGTQKPVDSTESANRYVSISVERGWTSKRDLIGYYNPLTRSFDASDSRVYDGLKLLDCESRNNENVLPFVILLDEANLSPMEYYWADFMNVCDDWTPQSNINTGEKARLSIAKTLRFLATINNDHTTEILSPRLIDRAWIVTLPAVFESNVVQLEYTPVEAVVSWSDFEKTFMPSSHEAIKLTQEPSDILHEIYDMFKGVGVSISPRTNNAICKYWSVAQKYFVDDESKNIDKTIVAVDYAIAQKLLPKINGVGVDYKEFLLELQKYCFTRNLLKSSEILTNVINSGKQMMDYYKFFN